MKDLIDIVGSNQKFIDDRTHDCLFMLIKKQTNNSSVIISEDQSTFHKEIINKLLDKSKRISTINLAGKEYEYHVNHRYNNRFIFFMNLLDNKTIILDKTDTKQDT